MIKARITVTFEIDVDEEQYVKDEMVQPGYIDSDLKDVLRKELLEDPYVYLDEVTDASDIGIVLIR